MCMFSIEADCFSRHASCSAQIQPGEDYTRSFGASQHIDKVYTGVTRGQAPWSGGGGLSTCNCVVWAPKKKGEHLAGFKSSITHVLHSRNSSVMPCRYRKRKEALKPFPERFFQRFSENMYS